MKLNIKELMEKNKFDENTLSKKIEVSLGTVKNWCSGVKNCKPSLVAIEKLCNAFNCTIQELVEIEKVELPQLPEEVLAEKNITLEKELQEKIASEQQLIQEKDTLLKEKKVFEKTILTKTTKEKQLTKENKALEEKVKKSEEALKKNS